MGIETGRGRVVRRGRQPKPASDIARVSDLCDNGDCAVESFGHGPGILPLLCDKRVLGKQLVKLLLFVQVAHKLRGEEEVVGKS